MNDWNELEFIQRFPTLASSSSSPTHSTTTNTAAVIKSKESGAEMIWSSQTLVIDSSPPTDVGIG